MLDNTAPEVFPTHELGDLSALKAERFKCVEQAAARAINLLKPAQNYNVELAVENIQKIEKAHLEVEQAKARKLCVAIHAHSSETDPNLEAIYSEVPAKRDQRAAAIAERQTVEAVSVSNNVFKLDEYRQREVSRSYPNEDESGIGLIIDRLGRPSSEGLTPEQALIWEEAKKMCQVLSSSPALNYSLFCLNPQMWVRCEQAVDQADQLETTVTKYKIGEHGITRAQGFPEVFQVLSEVEKEKLLCDIFTYQKLVVGDKHQPTL